MQGMPAKASKAREAQIAKLTARLAELMTGEPAEKGKNHLGVAFGLLGASKGGHARAAKLSPKKRSAIAKKAAAARWSAKRA